MRNNLRFCPVNVKDDVRPYCKMTDVLYRKIIDQLAEMRYSGQIAFHSNNEPLMDKDLEKKIAYAHEKCPETSLYFYTNGILLNAEKVKGFINAGINKIVINNYTLKKELNSNIRNIIREVKEITLTETAKIIVIIRDTNEVLNNRAGNSPNKSLSVYDDYKYYVNLSCKLPFEQLIIRPDGKISLCCQDAYGDCTLGDANAHSLKDIWFGNDFAIVRNVLNTKGRKELSLCSKCDG